MTFVHLLVAVRAASAVLGCHVTTADGAKQLAQCDHMPVPLNASNNKGTKLSQIASIRCISRRSPATQRSTPSFN